MSMTSSVGFDVSLNQFYRENKSFEQLKVHTRIPVFIIFGIFDFMLTNADTDTAYACSDISL